jgi:DNA mismatch repair ATPase MutS
MKGAVNYNIAAKKRGDDIIFLRKIIKGSTDDSYGIEVAKLAGVPNEVIRRAKEILSIIEKTVPDVNVAKNTKRKEFVPINAIPSAIILMGTNNRKAYCYGMYRPMLITRLNTENGNIMMTKGSWCK